MKEEQKMYKCYEKILHNQLSHAPAVLYLFSNVVFVYRITEILMHKKLTMLSSQQKFIYYEPIASSLAKNYLIDNALHYYQTGIQEKTLSDLFDQFSTLISNVIAVCNQAGMGSRENQELYNFETAKQLLIACTTYITQSNKKTYSHS